MTASRKSMAVSPPASGTDGINHLTPGRVDERSHAAGGVYDESEIDMVEFVGHGANPFAESSLVRCSLILHLLHFSPGGAADSSPRRKPWV